MKPNVNSWRTSRRIAACLAVGLFLAACSSDDENSAPPDSDATEEPSATSAAGGDPCADRDELRSSIDALTEVDVVAEGTNGLEPAIEAVTEDLAAVQESAGDDIQPEVDAVGSALDDVEAAVSNGSAEDAAQIAASLSTLAGTASELLEALDAGPCAS
jgi:ABC-type glycerol-3-phosphate transport system substrate-binding protein